MSFRRLALLVAVLAAAIPARGADGPDGDRPVSFREDVAPILVRSCLGCHDDRKAKSGLNMKTFALLRQGGETLAEGILEPGDPDASYLIELVRPDGEPRMPYKQKPLSDDEIATLERWVAQGAKFDGSSESETLIASLIDPLKNLPKISPEVPTSAPITALAYAPDGQRLAAAIGTEVLIFDAAKGQPVATLTDHPGPLKALRFTTDGKALIAAGGRAGMFGSLIVWNVESKTRLYDLRGHADQILAIDLAPDGRTLISGSYDGLAKLWDIVEGQELKTLKEHTDAIYGVAFAPDGKTVATASGDRTVKVWDVASGRKRASLSDATAELYAATFAPDGKTLFAAGVDRSIRAYTIDGDTITLARSAFAHDAAVIRLVVAPDGQTLLSSGEDKVVKFWDLATLEPRATLGDQPDWPLALAVSPDGSKLAVGRYDGSLAVFDAKTHKPLVTLREAPKPEPPEPAKPELVRNATLGPPSPRGASRGQTITITLGGNGIGQTKAIHFPEPGIQATLKPLEKPNPNAIQAVLTIAPDARVGVHRFFVRTPIGTPGAQSFAVSAFEERPEVEPNDDPSKAPAVALPATLNGTIDKPGEVDHFRFEAKAGQSLVFETLARGLGSGLNGMLTLLDDSGRVVAEALNSEGGLDPLLIASIPRDGSYTLRVADMDLGGSGNHFYRIQAGTFPYVESIFPLSYVPAGGPEGGASRIEIRGVNLSGLTSVEVPPGGPTTPWTIRELPLALSDGSRPINRTLVMTAGDRVIEDEANDEPAKADPIAMPGGVSGRIETPGDVDHFAFPAKQGRKVVVEVYGRRLGTPIDPVIEILDAEGKPVPRAVLRPVEETAVQFRDHNSTGRNVRLTWPWDGFAVGDTILVGRELTRIHELPRNPDDDAVLWGLGHGRTRPGARLALLGTTPEHHPMGQPIYKVEVHPPGTTFPPGGVPPVTLDYRNDDGGPGFQKDAFLIFDPPADGTYLVRVEDVRGLGGETYGYQVVVRDPKPDFTVSLGTENPNVPRGGAIAVPVEVRRIDGYRGPVEVWIEGLPAGITATSAVVEADQYIADILFAADASAPAFPEGHWVVKAKAQVGESPADVVEHTIDPGGPDGGWITVTPEPNLKVGFRPDRVVIRPGERVEMTLTIERRNGFQGRVPINVMNLPFGVRVLHIGLNGVLVTESQTERSIFLYAEPWVKPMERPFYAVARCEAAGTDDSTAPIPLVVLPAPSGPRATVEPESAVSAGAPR